MLLPGEAFQDEFMLFGKNGSLRGHLDAFNTSAVGLWFVSHVVGRNSVC